MSDIPNREELEERLARAVGGQFRGQLRELLDLMGDPPDLASVPLDFWDNGGKEMRGVVIPVLADIYQGQALILVREIQMGIEWGLINQRSIDWAGTYAFDLVSGLTDRTRRVVQDAFDIYYRDALSKKELIDLLTPAFGPVRAEMIAITEVTRAAVEGERALVDEIERANPNIRMTPIWQTANDERVCPVCGERHDKPIEDGEFPPAHPRCRCWVNHEMVVIE
jgi:hypothetical protein